MVHNLEILDTCPCAVTTVQVLDIHHRFRTASSPRSWLLINPKDDAMSIRDPLLREHDVVHARKGSPSDTDLSGGAERSCSVRVLWI